MHQCRKAYFLSTEPQQDLPRTPKLRHLRKDQLDRLLDPSHIVLLNFAIGGPAVTNWQRKLQLTAPRLLSNGFLAALSEKVQFELTHRALEPQQQPVIEQARVIDAVGIYDKRPHQAAQFNEVMPITPIARQARSL